MDRLIKRLDGGGPKVAGDYKCQLCSKFWRGVERSTPLKHLKREHGCTDKPTKSPDQFREQRREYMRGWREAQRTIAPAAGPMAHSPQQEAMMVDPPRPPAPAAACYGPGSSRRPSATPPRTPAAFGGVRAGPCGGAAGLEELVPVWMDVGTRSQGVGDRRLPSTARLQQTPNARSRHAAFVCARSSSQRRKPAGRQTRHEEDGDDEKEEQGEDEEDEDEDDIPESEMARWRELRSNASILPAHRGLGGVGVIGAAVNPEVAEESVAVLCYVEACAGGGVPGQPPVQVQCVTGSVARESVLVAYSWTWMNAGRIASLLGLTGPLPFQLRPGHDPLIIKTLPHRVLKCGSSLTVALAMALTSFVLGIGVRHKVGVTGEVDLRGRVTRIESVYEKCHAMASIGVRTLLCPAENGHDLHPPNVSLQVVDHLFDVARLLFMPERGTSTAPPVPWVERGFCASAHGMVYDHAIDGGRLGASMQCVQVAVMQGSGQLTVTGQVGSTLRTGIEEAVAWIMARLTLFEPHRVPGFQPSALQVHVHIPSLADETTSNMLELPVFAGLVAALQGRICKPDVILFGELDNQANLLRSSGVSRIDVECLGELDGLEDVTTLVVHRENVMMWKQGIAQYGSGGLKARKLAIVGVRTALEALPHVVAGAGMNGVEIDFPPLTPM